ncbi:A/G-specific adenine glycosylase [Pedobacter sp. Hv1]|uniref:A/G-specific adenine glycosylase n=1 Tax=Pedobacter sp. Hv1 TaxID=1740090 RepID=UPI0006D8A060|nr:A/G-specific adenine glycosylase [Pedobacter sp. Hv1]KQB99305.1 A/G-specific adenine glycosylase [Pedobacter sp. Hv1]
MNFQNEIIKWYKVNKRELPWRNTTDAYVIWLSEIILQQTRVEQGLPYFNKFLANFPTVSSFAAASEIQVLKLWQGLGYYSRGRNMLFTAKQVVDMHHGAFPVQYDELVKLKGIGEYTAAAISSFSNNEAKAVLDGNVFRVLARYFGIEEPINSTAGKKIFTALAQSLIENEQPALYNQAIMEFGALQCKPKSPLCHSCPIQLGCYALKNKKVDVLPIKLKKVKVKKRWFNYFVGISDGHILTKQRSPGDIWQQLFDFPLIETDEQPSLNQADFIKKVKNEFGEDVKITLVSEKKHLLTHQIIYVQFFALDNYIINFNLKTDIKSVLLEEFEDLPHPKVISDFIDVYIKTNQI